MAESVLTIPVWFDRNRGHEGAPNGRIIVGPLKWYRAPVHNGQARRAIRARFGAQSARECVYLYEILCQASTAQPIEYRGAVWDRYGAPMTVEDIASMVQEPADWVAETLEKLVEFGWVRWENAAAVKRVGASRLRRARLKRFGHPSAIQAPSKRHPNDRPSSSNSSSSKLQLQLQQQQQTPTPTPTAPVDQSEAGSQSVAAAEKSDEGLLVAAAAAADRRRCEAALVRCGFDRETRMQLGERICWNAETLAGVLQQAKRRKAKNPVGFIRSAIMDGWGCSASDATNRKPNH